MMPRVTVIMPFFNSERFIADAVSSILAQTFTDWDLLLINDGSTDSSTDIVKQFMEQDSRIRLLQNESNMGLVYTRNRGMNSAKTEYVALLDSDDLAAPDRLMRQIEFLDNNKDFSFVGSFVKRIDEYGKSIGQEWKNSAPAEYVPSLLFFHNYFTQSAITIRRSFLPLDPYRPGFAPAEDFDLWIRLADQGKSLNLPYFLTSYRLHQANISQIKKDVQNNALNDIFLGQLRKIGISATPEQLELHRSNFLKAENGDQFLRRREAWLLLLIDKNRSINHFPCKIFEQAVAEMWLSNCYANHQLGFSAWRIFLKSKLSGKINVKRNFIQILKLLYRCLIDSGSILKNA